MDVGDAVNVIVNEVGVIVVTDKLVGGCIVNVVPLTLAATDVLLPKMETNAIVYVLLGIKLVIVYEVSDLLMVCVVVFAEFALSVAVTL